MREFTFSGQRKINKKMRKLTFDDDNFFSLHRNINQTAPNVLVARINSRSIGNLIATMPTLI